MPHFVYMLECEGGRIYTGYAVDVKARFKQHQLGKGAKFTKAFPPKKILVSFEIPSKNLALRLEAGIKKLSHQEKSKLVQGDKGIKAILFQNLKIVCE